MDAAHVLTMLQMTDSIFPTGAFSHSNGLEAYTDRRLIQRADDLRDLLATRLIEGIARLDLIAVRAAMAAYTEEDYAAIPALDARLSAMKIAQETREASHKIGRQMLRTFLALEADDLLAAYQRDINDGICAGHHPLVHGLAYAHFEIDESAALLAYTYGQIAGQVAAAIKLVAIGQTSAQQILHDLIPVMQQAVEEAQARPLDDWQAFTPALEIRAMQHRYLFRRLFIS